MASNLKSQNLSIMMTDIQGYTNTSSGCSREEIVELIRRHNKLMVPVIQFYGGTIIKSIGDAFLCTFPSATDAVVCAIIIQLMLREYNNKQKDESRKLNLRVVINTGDVSIEEKDIYGEAVNVTARIEGLECFPGGSIGISESTHLLMNRNEIIAERIGPQTLKGIPEPVTVYRVPLEKQKLTSIPAKLSELVERAVSGKEASSLDLSEYTKTMTNFLKEKKLGENIQNLGKNIGKNIANTFGQKTVLESKQAQDLREAGIPKRLMTFLVDAVILFIPCYLIQWILGYVGVLVSMAAVFGYFAALWMIKGATLGQIALHTAVVKADGSPLDAKSALIRSGVFMVSCLFLGLGTLSIFSQLQKTAFDHVAGTKVIE